MPSQTPQKLGFTDAFQKPALLSCVLVFAATFWLFGMFWPAMSTGVHSSITVEFCLPHHVSSLSKTEVETLETLLANQVSSQLTGKKFESLIWQTQRSGPVNSSSIEYFDHETIRENIGLSLAFRDEVGRLRIEFACQGYSDQLRFLQLVSQQVATSVDRFFISKTDGIVASNPLNSESFDRVIWLANQIQNDLNQIQNTRSASHNQIVGGNDNPYSFASAKRMSSEQTPSQRSMMSENELKTIDANPLLSSLHEIKTQTKSPLVNDATFSVLSVGPIESRAINATPGRGELLGLLAVSFIVTGVVALFQFVPAKAPTKIESLSETLGIPVVAVLPAGSDSHTSNSDFLSTVAQWLIQLSKYFLIFLAVIVISFSILDNSIRQAFFQNPFDGLARIFGVFFGHA